MRTGEGRPGTQADPPLRLLHVFPTFAVGGAQRRFGELVRLHGPRYRHTIIALDGHFEMAERLDGNVAFELARTDFDKTRHLANIPAIRRTLRVHAPHALVTYNWGAIEWAFANRWRPIAQHIHIEDGFGPEERTHQLKRRMWFRRIALSGSRTRVVVPSRQLLKIAQENWRLPTRTVTYLPNGVDCEKFSPRITGGAKSVLVIGTIAALRAEKNIARLIRAFAQSQSRSAQTLQLAIFGDGPERASLEELVRSLGLQGSIAFRGATSAPENALAEMDVFAITSDTEQMPLSVLEAMAAGLPIVAVNVGDVAAMVSENNLPFVTRLGDDEALAASLISLANDASLRMGVGQVNRQTALARFDNHLMAARYAELFG